MSERERTWRYYNLHIIDSYGCDAGGMPPLHKVDVAPVDLVGFNYVRSGRSNPSHGVHFFLDDYQFQRVWAHPERYVRGLSGYGCTLSPDFSLYTDMPLPMQLWNVYRSRAVASYWQSCGLTVVPTLQWSDERSYAFSLAGLPAGGTVAVSTVGVRSDREATRLWFAGFEAALDLVRPSRVLHFGDPTMAVAPDGVEVCLYRNHVIERMENGRQGRR